MKTIKVISSIVLLMVSMVSFSQTASTGSAAKPSVYLVQIPHTSDQCVKTLTDLKGKGDAFLSKFEFGCMSGDHTGYAFLSGKSENDVRLMLPKDVQASAKIEKVDKFTADQIDKLHKDKM